MTLFEKIMKMWKLNVEKNLQLCPRWELKYHYQVTIGPSKVDLLPDTINFTPNVSMRGPMVGVSQVQKRVLQILNFLEKELEFSAAKLID